MSLNCFEPTPPPVEGVFTSGGKRFLTSAFSGEGALNMAARVQHNLNECNKPGDLSYKCTWGKELPGGWKLPDLSLVIEIPADVDEETARADVDLALIL
jgi:hypothetical protein